MLLRFLIVVLFGINSNQDAKTIIFYGDSLTAGYGLAPEYAFPALVDGLLRDQGLDYKVVNAGVSGETSSGGVTRIDWILNQKVDIFVLELGANDGLRGIPTEKTFENLQEIIQQVRSKYPACKIVVVGMHVPPNMGKEYADNFSGIYPRLVKESNTAFMPFLLTDVAGNPDLNLPDGIHPNAEGHKIVAKNILKVLEPLL
jgi:acyl-CoA thioesterase-1